MKKGLLIEELLKPYVPGHAAQKSTIFDVLRKEFAHHTGKGLDDIPEGWLFDRNTTDLLDFTLSLLKKYHPDLAHERQKFWTDIEKFNLVYAVECMHVIGYGKRQACELLAPGDRSMYRRYAKFKKDGGWFSRDGPTVSQDHAKSYVKDILRLPLL